MNGFSQTHLKFAQVPWPEQSFGQIIVWQASPFQPWRQIQVPLSQYPCSAQESAHKRMLQSAPRHPGLQKHLFGSLAPQMPWREQSFSQTMMEQSAPFQPGMHLQLPSLQTPLPAQMALSFIGQVGTSQAFPVQSLLHVHCPLFSHFPCPEQSFGQRGYEQSTPLQRGSQVQFPLRQVPWSLQSFGQARSLQSSPANPA